MVRERKFFHFFSNLKLKESVMDNTTELQRLEQFVDKLLNKYNQLKADYLALQETLRERDAECADLKNNVANLSSERTEVGSRVAGLLDRIEQWRASMPVVRPAARERCSPKAATTDSSTPPFR